jgi:predicted small lipoprotein YifL
MRLHKLAFLLFTPLLLAACGQSGPLYFPQSETAQPAPLKLKAKPATPTTQNQTQNQTQNDNTTQNSA